MLSEMTINILTESGFKRWTKNGMDRLYVNASSLGLEYGRHNTGTIAWAEFRGEHISNSEARRMLNAKSYIDVKTGYAHSDSTTLLNAMQELLAGIESGRWEE